MVAITIIVVVGAIGIDSGCLTQLAYVIKWIHLILIISIGVRLVVLVLRRL